MSFELLPEALKKLQLARARTETIAAQAIRVGDGEAITLATEELVGATEEFHKLAGEVVEITGPGKGRIKILEYLALEKLAKDNNLDLDIVISGVARIVSGSVIIFECTDKGLTDISALSMLRKLIELDLYKNSIEDISPLSKLTDLTILWLHNNQIVDIAPLSDFTSLETVWIQDNPVSYTHLTLPTKA